MIDRDTFDALIHRHGPPDTGCDLDLVWPDAEAADEDGLLVVERSGSTGLVWATVFDDVEAAQRQIAGAWDEYEPGDYLAVAVYRLTDGALLTFRVTHTATIG